MSKPRTGIPADVSPAPPFSTARTGTKTASDYSPPHNSGLKTVANEAAWGEQVASNRYGGSTKHPDMGRTPSNIPQDPVDKPTDPNYNDCRKSWKQGADESAMGKPNFDPRNKSGEAKKW